MLLIFRVQEYCIDIVGNSLKCLHASLGIFSINTIPMPIVVANLLTFTSTQRCQACRKKLIEQHDDFSCESTRRELRVGALVVLMGSDAASRCLPDVRMLGKQR